jgi:hypothetical protein
MFLNIDHCFSRLFGFCCLLHEYTPAFNACSLCICRPIESAAAIVIVVMPDHQLFGRVVDITSILPPPLFFCDGHVVQDLRQVYPLNWVISSCGTNRLPACTHVLYLDYYVCESRKGRSV